MTLAFYCLSVWENSNGLTVFSNSFIELIQESLYKTYTFNNHIYL